MSFRVLLFIVLIASSIARADTPPKPSVVPLETVHEFHRLFRKHYPKATFTDKQFDGVHVDYNVAVFEFPSTSRTGKRETEKQTGPEKGGIVCRIYHNKGPYLGQVALLSRSDGQHHPYVVRDRKIYKQLLAAPFSVATDSHLWVSLSYPPDATKEFHTDFKAVMDSFRQLGDGRRNK